MWGDSGCGRTSLPLKRCYTHGGKFGKGGMVNLKGSDARRGKFRKGGVGLIWPQEGAKSSVEGRGGEIFVVIDVRDG